MRTLGFLLQKEFKQIFRDSLILRVIFIIPIVQLIVIPLAADYEIKNINISIIDKDGSTTSQSLIYKLESSPYFNLISVDQFYEDALHHLEKDEADVVLEIPSNFGNNLISKNTETMYITINAINGVKASVGGLYLQQILSGFNDEIRYKWNPDLVEKMNASIQINEQYWFNPNLVYDFFMVPGILVLLVTMVGVYLTSLNIVKEKEIGTIEQINVTPVRKSIFILSKLIPFLIIGIVVFSIGLLVVTRFVYGIIPVGSYVTIYLYLILYLIAVIGVGLLISTYSNTQQQAMSLAFFIMMIFIMMSGLFTPIDSMPEWAIWIAKLNPPTYFIEVMRFTVLKGSTINELSNQFLIMIAFALIFNVWAVTNYKKTV